MRNRRIPLLAIVGASAAALLLLSVLNVGAPAEGWLCAFVLVSMVPVGSLVLLLVHGITGGRWGHDLKPVIEPAARVTPLLIPLILPVFLFRSVIYAWPEHGVPPDVGRLYMNAPFFELRSLLALGIWAFLGWSAAWRRPLTAALGLVAHAICLVVIPADWILSVQAGAYSAGFGFGFGIEQILAAFAFIAILSPQGQDPRANRDLVAMMLSALLGVIYFVYVQYLIIWFGNIPEKVAWYAARTAAPWPAVASIAFFLGAVAPFCLCLSPTIRQSPRWLRLVGAAVGAGIILHILWLLIPSLGYAALGPALLSVILMAGLLLALADHPLLTRGEADHAQA